MLNRPAINCDGAAPGRGTVSGGSWSASGLKSTVGWSAVEDAEVALLVKGAAGLDGRSSAIASWRLGRASHALALVRWWLLGPAAYAGTFNRLASNCGGGPPGTASAAAGDGNGLVLEATASAVVGGAERAVGAASDCELFVGPVTGVLAVVCVGGQSPVPVVSAGMLGRMTIAGVGVIGRGPAAFAGWPAFDPELTNGCAAAEGAGLAPPPAEGAGSVGGDCEPSEMPLSGLRGPPFCVAFGRGALGVPRL